MIIKLLNFVKWKTFISPIKIANWSLVTETGNEKFSSYKLFILKNSFLLAT